MKEIENIPPPENQCILLYAEDYADESFVGFLDQGDYYDLYIFFLWVQVPSGDEPPPIEELVTHWDYFSPGMDMIDDVSFG